MNKSLNELFEYIRKECLMIISKKKINIDELSFRMGIKNSTLYDLLMNKNEDLSIYLKLYEVLLGW